jgi:hypothetical protein
MNAAGRTAGTQAEDINTRIGKLSFTHDFANGYPTDDTVEKLYDERGFQRACQLYLWALPIVSFAEWQEQYRTTFGASDLDVVLYHSYKDKLGLLTANATTPYIVSITDLGKTGPLVVDMPGGAASGLVDDFWQRPLTDLGLAGPDQGKGAKYLIVGPGQTVTDTAGFIVVNSSTLNVLFGFRNLETDPVKADRLLKAYRLYPYGQRHNPPPTRYLEVGGKQWSQIQPRGLAYWARLSEILNREPVQERDRIMVAMLRSIGIEKGKPFNPDARQKKIFTDAALLGEAMAKANDFDKRQMELSHYADGVHWHFSLCLDITQESEFYTQLDERTACFYEAVTTSKGMVTTAPGVGSVYLGTYKDKDGDWLDGAESYRLHVPPKAPVTQFWSLTVYDVATRCLIDNKEERADRSSRHADLVKNADGSVDLYVGPKAPAGFEKNWIPTLPGKAWFPYFRLFGPTEEHFNRKWILPDIEKAK